MKWCRFQTNDGPSFGFIEDGTVVRVSGSPFTGYERSASTVPLDSAKLLVPIVPPTFYAAGVNYRKHVTQMAQLRGEAPKFPPQADVGYRANNALIAQGEAIVIPPDATELVQYEGELVAVIGKRCHNVTEDEVLD